MKAIPVERARIKGAWEGRVSGCMLGKPLELVSILQGRDALRAYLEDNNAWPLRDYVPLSDNPLVKLAGEKSCKGHIERSEPDDDINYTVLALIMLEDHGLDLKTTHVAGAWLRYLPAAHTFTAERAAYRTLLKLVDDTAVIGLRPDLDLSECAQNEFSEFIGAQIRADMYGWVCPGNPKLAADLARRDASLSHTGEGINGAVFIAALAAAIPASNSIDEAIEAALKELPEGSASQEAVRFGISLVGKQDAVERLHEKYKHLHPVHTINNLALVVWGILNGGDEFSKAIGDTVAAGWDTDCNGATVGGLWGISGKPVPKNWTEAWKGKVAVNLAGVGELKIQELTQRTKKVADMIKVVSIK
jgi:ADP-ribosylglycohydrolase